MSGIEPFVCDGAEQKLRRFLPVAKGLGLKILWVQGEGTFCFFDHVNFKFRMPRNYIGSFGQFESFPNILKIFLKHCSSKAVRS